MVESSWGCGIDTCAARQSGACHGCAHHRPLPVLQVQDAAPAAPGANDVAAAPGAAAAAAPKQEQEQPAASGAAGSGGAASRGEEGGAEGATDQAAEPTSQPGGPASEPAALPPASPLPAGAVGDAQPPADAMEAAAATPAVPPGRQKSGAGSAKKPATEVPALDAEDKAALLAACQQASGGTWPSWLAAGTAEDGSLGCAWPVLCAVIALLLLPWPAVQRACCMPSYLPQQSAPHDLHWCAPTLAPCCHPQRIM